MRFRPPSNGHADIFSRTRGMKKDFQNIDQQTLLMNNELPKLNKNRIEDPVQISLVHLILKLIFFII